MLVRLGDDVYQFGLRGVIDPTRQSDIAELILQARSAMQERLAANKSLSRLVEVFDPQSYNNWDASFSLTGGPDDDDDGDGLSNRTEYMLGGDPIGRSDAPQPVLGTASANGDTVPTYTLIRNLQASDATPGIQFSRDLVDWTTNAPVFISSVKQADGTAVLTFHGPWPIGDPSQPRGFFRTVEE